MSSGEVGGALAKYLDERVREFKVVDVSGFFSIAGNPIGKIAFRPPTALEQFTALRNAHSYAKEMAAGNESFEKDPDFLDQVKLAFIMHVCCRDAENPANAAFAHPRWMFEKIEPERIGVLVRIANSVRAELGPEKIAVGDEFIDGVKDALVATAGTEQVHVVLGGLPREHLDYVACSFALKIANLEKEVAFLREGRDTITNESATTRGE